MQERFRVISYSTSGRAGNALARSLRVTHRRAPSAGAEEVSSRPTPHPFATARVAERDTARRDATPSDARGVTPRRTAGAAAPGSGAAARLARSLSYCVFASRNLMPQPSALVWATGTLLPLSTATTASASQCDFTDWVSCALSSTAPW